jgi:predicted nuclease of predicted toxin-antitoxin system
MKFFVDNNLSPQLAKGMKAFGEDVIHITEIFPHNTDDTGPCR